jgi:hypothetical protein
MRWQPPEHIELAGCPEAVPEIDGRYAVTISLSASPSLIWRRSFLCGKPRPPLCYPDLIRFSGDVLRFASAAPDIGTWIACVKAWIAEANQRCADYARSPYRTDCDGT